MGLNSPQKGPRAAQPRKWGEWHSVRRVAADAFGAELLGQQRDRLLLAGLAGQRRVDRVVERFVAGVEAFVGRDPVVVGVERRLVRGLRVVAPACGRAGGRGAR
jgi:hypothetical protein